MPRNKYAELAPTRILKWLLKFPIVGISVHWLFQGLLYMDKTERWFKLTLDAVLTVLIGSVLNLWITIPYNWLLGLFIAHTLNFLFNSHPWALLKHYGLINNTQERFWEYSNRLFARIRSEPSLAFGAVYGSVVRGDWSPSSDLDTRLISRPGFGNHVRACLFTMIERSRAMLNRFPIDVYMQDDFSLLARMRDDEKPLIIKGAHDE
ncbi:MAG TPA: hypothetical protein VMC09_02815 [Anaerolineales bacterium]|nr:hypothetical protein [Anaerolineales bacterium]